VIRISEGAASLAPNIWTLRPNKKLKKLAIFDVFFVIPHSAQIKSSISLLLSLRVERRRLPTRSVCTAGARRGCCPMREAKIFYNIKGYDFLIEARDRQRLKLAKLETAGWR
jgi:hypothetical protein